MSKKYIVHLTEEERAVLTDVVGKGKAAAYKIVLRQSGRTTLSH